MCARNRCTNSDCKCDGECDIECDIECDTKGGRECDSKCKRECCACRDTIRIIQTKLDVDVNRDEQKDGTRYDVIIEHGGYSVASCSFLANCSLMRLLRLTRNFRVVAACATAACAFASS